MSIIAALSLVVGLSPTYAIADSPDGGAEGAVAVDVVAAADLANDEGAAPESGPTAQAPTEAVADVPTEAVADAPDGTKALAASSSTDDVDYADSSAARTSTDTTDDAVEPPAAKAPAAEKAAAVDGAKGDTRGQYAIYTYASPADGGMVTTNVSSADEMDDVYITAAPAAGYAVSEVVVTNSDGEEQRTFTQDDGTVLFWMPGSLARVYVTFTPTGASDPVVIDNVSITVTPPTAGTSSADGAPQVTVTGAGIDTSQTSAFWNNISGYSTDTSPFTFVEGNTYYAIVSLYPQDGYEFALGDSIPNLDIDANDYRFGGTVTVSGGTLHGNPGVRTSENRLRVWIAVTPEPAEQPSYDYFSVWMCTADHTPNTGGSVRIDYINPGGEAIPSTTWTSSTNQTVPAGILIALTAQPDEGYRFKGWYQANIDQASADDPHYLESKLVSTEKVYNFSGNPIGEGESPYICAVFEEGTEREAVAFQVWVGNYAGNATGDDPSGGQVAWVYEPTEPNTLELEGSDGTDFAYGRADCGCYLGDEVTVVAQPDEGYRFVGWYQADGEWPKNGNNKYTGDVLSTELSYTFAPTNTNRLICAVFEEVPTVYLCASATEGGGTYTITTPYSTHEGIEGGMNMAFAAGNKVTLAATAKDGYVFKGWYEGIRGSSGFVEDYDPDNLLSSSATYTFAVNENTNVYALFEQPTLRIMLIPHMGPSANLETALESLTVNGEEWVIPSGATSIEKPVPAGSTVTVTVKATDTGMIGMVQNTAVDAVNSVDGAPLYASGSTTFTMPDTFHYVVIGMTDAVLVNNDVNGGTKGDSWPGDTHKEPAVRWINTTALDVPAELDEATATPPAGGEFAGYEVTDKNGTHTGAPGETIADLDFTGCDEVTIKYLWSAPEHTVTFDAHGGSPEPDAQAIAHGETATQPQQPTKTNFSFGGWFDNPNHEGECFDFNTPITQDTELHAAWMSPLIALPFDKTNESTQSGGTIKLDDGEAEIGIIALLFEGTEVTLTAEPAEGYRFVGWSDNPSNPAGNIISTDTTIAVTVDGMDSFFAVFEESVTVSFDANGGSPAPDAQVIAKGGKATEPTGVTKANLSLLGWYESADFEGDEIDFDTATFEADATLYAAWYGQFVATSYDKTASASEAGGTIALGDHAGSTLISVSRVEGAEITLTATPDTGYQFVGWAEGSPGGGIVSTDETYTWTYDGSVKAVYAVFSQPVVTVRWSSVDGVDLMDPIVTGPVPVGSTVDEALATVDKTLSSHEFFRKDGYLDWGVRAAGPITDYSSKQEMWDDEVAGTDVVNADMVIYVEMFKYMDDAAQVTIEAPVCGAEAGTPEAAVPSGATYRLGSAKWCTDETGSETYSGSFTGGEDYYVKVVLDTDFGYLFARKAPVVNGEAPVDYLNDADYAEIIAKVTADHDPAAAVNENVVAPTCTEGGSHDEVVYCDGCGEEISSETVEDAALGHDWGAWTVVKEATTEADGLRQRTCTRCDETEEEAIPKTEVEIEYTCVAGEGASYTLESGKALAFIFKRNVDDDTTFAHFTGVLVDGKALSSDQYEAKAGSVMLTFEAPYLDTLSAGEHTLTVQFDDGEATADFTVVAAAAPDDEATADDEKEAEDAAEAADEPAGKAPSKAATIPATGDPLPLGALVALLIASAIALGASLAMRRAGRMRR